MGLTIKYREDLVLLPSWLLEIVKLHCSKGFLSLEYPIYIRNHVRDVHSNLELDLVITCGKKRIVVELKEADLAKVVEQIGRRKLLGDYAYIALNLRVHDIIGALRNYSKLLEHGIGIVSTRDNCIVIRAYSPRKISEARRYLELLEKI